MGRPLKNDLTDMRFGMLVAKEHVGSGRWLCKCDCGNETIVPGGNLLSGNTASCGCNRFNHEDITGRVFGRLTAKKFLGYGKWLCQCECGNEVSVYISSLKSGNTMSCGCLFKEVAGKGTFIDRTGTRYGHLVAEEYIGSGRWRCRCDCGNYTEVSSHELNRGGVTSCGCYRRATSALRHIKHGKSKERLYGIWLSMRQRCLNPNNSGYENYGGRGIVICDEWNEFERFYEWAMDNGYDPSAKFGECTIDRIDNDGSYSPDNCRWVSNAVQANNKRRRRVEQIDEQGNVIRTFDSTSSAAKAIGCSRSSVNSVCSGRDRTVYGAMLRYAPQESLGVAT